MDYPGKVITKNQVTPTQTSATGVWTLDDAAAAVKNNNWPVAGVPNPISKSLRFNSADTAYLNRTLTTPTNNKIFTFSAWVKRSGLAANQTLFDAFVPATSFDTFRFNSSDQLDYFDNTAGYLTSTQVFRDVGAWYHVMAAVDTTQATSSNRVKLYVNGTQITAFSATAYPSQNQAIIFNSAVAHNIGRFGYSANAYLSGYLTEINFIDGQQLTPSDFGLTNPQTGQWIPKKYTGTYGTNGFYLNFKDATSTTTLGYDYSGNNNNWTTNNFSVTAGAGNDSLTDVPTPWIAYNTTGDVGGVVRGNYCTWNSVDNLNSVTLSNGNLQVTGNGTTARGIRGTLSLGGSTPFYFEYTNTTNFNINYPMVGICAIDEKLGTGANDSATGPGKVIVLYPNGANWGAYSNGSLVTSGTATAYSTNGSIVMFAWDPSTGKFWMGVGGTWHNSGNPAAGTNPTGTISSFIGLNMTPTVSTYSTSDGFLNCGQRPFAYTPPAGFLSLCTTNLPNPTIGTSTTTQAGKYFNAVLYTGTGASLGVTGVGFQPDWTWIKSRSAATDHGLYDAVRGVQKQLESNNTDAETTETTGLTAFNSDGFTVGALAQLNTSSATYVAWNWKANGAGSSNTDGTITSTVSANTTAGFSVITYSGNGTDNATVGHGLGQPPKFLIWKPRNAVSDWMVWHIGLSGYNYDVRLNTTTAQGTGANPLNNTAPGSSVITLRNQGDVNGSGKNIVCYAFAAVAGYSAFGSYTGNGSTDGPFVYTGFRPRYVMVKRIDVANSWVINDAARNTYNVIGEYLSADQNYAGSDYSVIDFTSNGFKLRNTSNAWNGSGGTYVYTAFAESPFKFANAR